MWLTHTHTHTHTRGDYNVWNEEQIFFVLESVLEKALPRDWQNKQTKLRGTKLRLVEGRLAYSRENSFLQRLQWTERSLIRNRLHQLFQTAWPQLEGEGKGWLWPVPLEAGWQWTCFWSLEENLGHHHVPPNKTQRLKVCNFSALGKEPHSWRFCLCEATIGIHWQWHIPFYAKALYPSHSQFFWLKL